MALVLVIDDEGGMRTLVRRILEGAGHAVLEAENGKAGHRLFAQHSPDLVVTDILMPEKEGIETIRDLRKGHPAVRILAISGGGSTGQMNYLRMAQALGADAVLPKPFRSAALLETVERMLQGP